MKNNLIYDYFTKSSFFYISNSSCKIQNSVTIIIKYKIKRYKIQNSVTIIGNYFLAIYNENQNYN